MMSQEIEVLKGFYVGKTGVVVGSGPSIINLTKESFANVDVILTIDFAIAKIRLLNLSVPIYTMWKDHGTLLGTPDGVCNPCPGMPPCTHKCFKLPPQQPEIYVCHEHESKFCNEQYSPRYIFDQEKFGHHYGKPSVIAAIEIMRLFGVSNLKMMGFDSITTGNCQSCRDGLTVMDIVGGEGYLEYAVYVKDLLAVCTFTTVDFIK